MKGRFAAVAHGFGHYRVPSMTIDIQWTLPWSGERHAALWASVEQHMQVTDLAHDVLHVQRVYQWAVHLSPEAGCSADLAGAAALVHDAVQIPKHEPDRPMGGERSAELAAGLLPDAGYSAEECAEIVEAVRTCSWSRGLAPTGPLGALLQDADRLDAIGVIGFMRLTACAQSFAQAGVAGCFYHNDVDGGFSDGGSTLTPARVG